MYTSTIPALSIVPFDLFSFAFTFFADLSSSLLASVCYQAIRTYTRMEGGNGHWVAGFHSAGVANAATTPDSVHSTPVFAVPLSELCI